MSKEGPWIRFFPSDWLAGTRGLSAAETGVYITLISMMYERGAPIAYEPTRLARLCGTTSAALKSTVSMLLDAGKLEQQADGLWNGRVEKETLHRRDKSQQAAESAETRWRKEQQKQQSGNANAMRTQSERNANQSQTSDTPSLRSGVSERRRENPVLVLQAVLDPLTAKTYANHLGRKLTPEMAGFVVETLREVQRLGGNPADAVKLAMKKGWVSLDIEYLRNAGFKFAHGSPAPAEDWAGRMAVWREGTWSPNWGPKPGEPKCRVPPELLRTAA